MGGEVGDGGVGAAAEVIRKTGQREGHKESQWRIQDFVKGGPGI